MSFANCENVKLLQKQKQKTIIFRTCGLVQAVLIGEVRQETA